MNVAYRKLCQNVNYIRNNRKYLFKIIYSWWNNKTARGCREKNEKITFLEREKDRF
jgi:hypothetical protein